ncbi:hypothetical protein [Zongyangia hominis]|uniref:Uncharacterized protein n=1 Tax=Zongyangia hominis TaxID=2763677 RepID=A0A926IC99_9FIRM|nr:hypothetical protein [Zongyangia hominis]MBC8570992.1 hypothetical protein [Zongyangia hominis]
MERKICRRAFLRYKISESGESHEIARVADMSAESDEIENIRWDKKIEWSILPM